MEGKCLLTMEQSRDAGEVTARLLADQDDTFFFDHTLDHLPGMLLIAALLDLVRAEGDFQDAGPDGRISLSLDFHRFCELDDRITLFLRRLTGDDNKSAGWRLGAETGQKRVCTGSATLHPKSPTRFVPDRPAAPGPSVLSAELVHRAQAENVLVSSAHWAGERLTARVQRPPAEHSLHERPVEQLVEAARQFATLAGHVGHEMPLDSKYVLCRVHFELPWELPAGQVHMEWESRPPQENAFDLRVSLYHASGGGLLEEVGSVNFDALIVSPHQYQAIRFRRPRNRSV